MIPRRFSLILTAVSVVLGALLPSGCGSSDLGNEEPLRVAVNTNAPEWGKDIKLVMQYKCMNCHANPRPSHAPSDTRAIALDTYDEFVKWATQVRTRVFEDPLDPMPPEYGTPLSSEEKAALKKFVEETIAQNPSTGTDALKLSQAFKARCAGCHGNQGEGGPTNKPLPGSRKSAPEFIAFVRKGKGGMPPFDASQISDAELTADYGELGKRE